MKSRWSADRAVGQRALLRFLQRQDRLPAAAVPSLEQKAQREGLSVPEILERDKIITEKDLAVLLATTLRLRLIDLTAYPLDPQVARELKENIATSYEVVPIRLDDGVIEVATANPLDLDALKAVEFATGKRVQAVVATRTEVLDALAHAYRLQESLELFLQHVPAENVLTLQELNDAGTDLRTIALEAELPPVVKLADLILIEGIKSRASDVHVEPATDGVIVRYRIDGILEEAFRFPKWVQSALTARLKVMAKLDITERRVPQDGRIGLRYQERVVDLRVSSLPAQHGEKITLRILDAASVVHSIERIGLAATDLQRMRDAVRRPEGLILITGPTGSGKTTTLYALLREKISPNVNIVTIENPIEYQMKGINQVEVNEKQGLTFANVLRSVLRQDPDVILVGEIRDQETAQIAFQAAQTGHLVLTTIHTNDAAAAVTRLIDLGTEPYAIASATNLIVAQRLVRRVCQSCSAPTTPSDEIRRLLHLENDGTFRCGTGCLACRQTGFVGRTGVYEVLAITPSIAKLIEAGAGEIAVRQQARAEGVKSLLEDARDKVAAGMTTPEELLRVVQVNEQGLRCPACQEEISQDYAVCPRCGLVLRATCGSCAKPLNAGWATCPYCGAKAKSEEEAETSLAAGSALGGAEQPSRRQRTYKALVVDDNPAIRDIVRLTLEHSRLGLSVITAEDGNAALELAAVERPDVVLLDLQMPGLDGLEVCRRLRSDVRTAFVPVLMLTAQAGEESSTQGFAAGTDDYMTKPFRRDDLIVRVRRMLERTYGKEAAGETPPEETASSEDAKRSPTVVGDEPGGSRVDVADEGGLERLEGTLARLMADREALAMAIQACETRLAELGARLDATADLRGETSEASPTLDDVRHMVEQMLTAREHTVAEAREAAAQARHVAEEGLRHFEENRVALARGMEGEKECAQRWQALTARVEVEAGLRAEVAAAAAQTAHQIEEVRSEVAEWREEQARAVTEVRSEARGAQRAAEEALRRLQEGATELAARVGELAGLQGAIDAVTADQRQTVYQVEDVRNVMAQWRKEQTRVVWEVRSEAQGVQQAAEEGLRRLQERATELAARVGELAGLQGAIDAVTADQRQTAHQVEEVRGAIAQWREEQTRAVEDARGEAGGAQQAAEETLRRLHEGAAELGVRVGELAGLQGAIDAVAADQRQTVHQVEEVRGAIAQWREEQTRAVWEVRSEAQGVPQVAEESLRRLQEGATELAARVGELAGLQGAIDAVAADQRQTVHQVEEVRNVIAEWREEQGRLASAVQAGGMSVSGGGQDTLLKFIDGCEVQLTEFAARLDADAALRSKVAAAAATTTVRQFDELGAAIEQLRQEQAQTVAVARAEAAEAGLAAARAVSRLEEIVTDAENQRGALAEIRTAIESLRADQVTLRSAAEGPRASLTALADTAAGVGDVLLGVRGMLIDCVRRQVEALKSGAPWTPGIRRALSLLVDSMLAAVVAPALRRLLGSSDATSAADATSVFDPPPDAQSPDEPSAEALFADV